MTGALKKFTIQIGIAAVFMLVVAAAIIITGTIGVSKKDFPAAYASTKTSIEGRKIFQRAGCTSCHQIMRQGGNGPDLTFVGNKFNQKGLKQVIRNPRKALGYNPAANLMPAFSKKDLPDDKLEILTKYLESLKEK